MIVELEVVVAVVVVVVEIVYLVVVAAVSCEVGFWTLVQSLYAQHIPFMLLRPARS